MKPFSRWEWVITILLALICVGIPLGMVLQFHVEMARQDAAALGSTQGRSR